MYSVRIKDPERRQFWIDALGTDVLPILDPNVQRAQLRDIPDARVHMLDQSRITDATLRKIVRQMSIAFGLDEQTVLAEAKHRGIPILATTFDLLTQ